MTTKKGPLATVDEIVAWLRGAFEGQPVEAEGIWVTVGARPGDDWASLLLATGSVRVEPVRGMGNVPSVYRGVSMADTEPARSQRERIVKAIKRAQAGRRVVNEHRRERETARDAKAAVLARVREGLPASVEAKDAGADGFTIVLRFTTKHESEARHVARAVAAALCKAVAEPEYVTSDCDACPWAVSHLQSGPNGREVARCSHPSRAAYPTVVVTGRPEEIVNECVFRRADEAEGASRRAS